MISRLVRYQVGASNSTSKVVFKNLDADFDFSNSMKIFSYSDSTTVTIEQAANYETRNVYQQTFVGLIVKKYYMYPRL